MKLSGSKVHRYYAYRFTVANDQPRHVPLVENVDAGVHQLPPESLNDENTGPVGAVSRSAPARAAELPKGDSVSRVTVECHPTVFHIDDGVSRIGAQRLDRVAFRNEIPGTDRIGRIGVGTVGRIERRVYATGGSSGA